MEQRDQNVFVDFWAKITNKDAVLRSTIISARFVSHRSKMFVSSAYLLSARPPPEAQLSLKGRFEFGIG